MNLKISAFLMVIKNALGCTFISPFMILRFHTGTTSLTD